MIKGMVSVMTVAYHSDDWLDVLRNSLSKFTEGEYELLAHDNGRDRNIGHGPALDLLAAQAKGEFLMALDVDAHLLMPGWDTAVKKRMEALGLDMLAAQGGMLKPVRPAVMAVRASAVRELGLSFAARELEGVKFDVGVHAYFRLLTEGRKVGMLKWVKRSRYPGSWGDEYELDGKLIAYHNWYGTRWWPDRETVDGRKRADYEARKAELFAELEKSGLWTNQRK